MVTLNSSVIPQIIFSWSQLIRPICLSTVLKLSNAFSPFQCTETNRNDWLSPDRSSSIPLHVRPQSNLQEPGLPHHLIKAEWG